MVLETMHELVDYMYIAPNRIFHHKNLSENVYETIQLHIERQLSQAIGALLLLAGRQSRTCTMLQEMQAEMARDMKFLQHNIWAQINAKDIPDHDSMEIDSISEAPNNLVALLEQFWTELSEIIRVAA